MRRLDLDSGLEPCSDGSQDSAALHHCPEAPMSHTRCEIQALKGEKEGNGGGAMNQATPLLVSDTHVSRRVL